jgi:hypothetical protein
LAKRKRTHTPQPSRPAGREDPPCHLSDSRLAVPQRGIAAGVDIGLLVWPRRSAQHDFEHDDWLTDEAGPEPNPSGAQSQIMIHCDELGKGWVYVHAETPPTDPSRLPYLLNDAFCRWLKQNPQVTVRSALPIIAGGNTVGIHVSFD